MLKTFFIATLVILPLAVAMALIAYRARYFVLGIAVIILVTMVIWAGIRVAAMVDKNSEAVPSGPANISCLASIDARPPLRCGL